MLRGIFISWLMMPHCRALAANNHQRGILLTHAYPGPKAKLFFFVEELVIFEGFAMDIPNQPIGLGHKLATGDSIIVTPL